MGRAHTFSTTATAESRTDVLAYARRAVDLAVSVTVLVLALPLMGVLALAVRRGSHGPVLHREPAVDARGRRVELLSFRTAVDGAGTTHHERLRAVVGAGDAATLTRVGRVLRATRTEKLPRLLNVVAGHASLLP